MKNFIDPSTNSVQTNFYQLADAAPDIVALLDKNLRHIYVNSAIEKFTGLKRESFIGKTNEELGMPKDLCIEWRRHFDKLLTTKEPVELDFSFPSPNGDLSFHSVMSPQLDSKGDVSTIICISRDVTNRHAKTKETILATKKSILAPLVAGIAHEVNNPLSILLNQLYVIEKTIQDLNDTKNGPIDSDKILRKIEMCYQQIDRIKDSIKALEGLDN